MSINESVFLSYLLSFLCFFSALYICFSRNLLTITLALFLEVTCVGMIFFRLNIDYLGLFLFCLGFAAIVLLSFFSSIISGNLRDFTSSIPEVISYKSVVSMILGLSIAGGLFWIFISNAFFRELVEQNENIDANYSVLSVLGQSMISEYKIVLQLFGVLILLSIVGVGTLIRNPIVMNKKD